jgi:hypothetical protein
VANTTPRTAAAKNETFRIGISSWFSIEQPALGPAGREACASARRRSRYADYGSALPLAATAAGLGNIGATWGCTGTCGTGFTLSSAKLRVGLYLSSNVDITVQVSAYRSGVLLGSQTPSIASDVIGFVGFEDAGGIDRIVIGDNTLCVDCIHQLDNVIFEDAGTGNQLAPIPTLSAWGAIVLSGLLALATVFALRRQRR